MNIFKEAVREIIREGKLNKTNSVDLVIDRAIEIRHYLDMQEKNEKVAMSRGLNRK